MCLGFFYNQTNKMNYELLLFDVDGTFFDYDYTEKSALISSLTEFDIEFTEEFLSIYRSINHDIWKEFERNN